MSMIRPSDGADSFRGSEVLHVPERTIDRQSSVGPETSEVLSMKAQAEHGRPVSAYEFAQGMVDYGLEHDPPPRIFLLYEDGHRETFTGTVKDRETIQAVEFVNNGPGLAPEDTVIIRHDPAATRTLGQHGRGTTVTLAYLESQGMHVEVESNHDDQETESKSRAWKIGTSLRRTETGKTETLHVQGKWLKQTSNQTVFRIFNPTPEFLDQLDQLPNYFLPANPAYPHASIIEKDREPKQIPLGHDLVDAKRGKTARIECLLGIIPPEEENFRTVFVDGLRVATTYSHERTILPWSISGARDLSENLQVGRSHDSGSVAGRGKVETLIQIALLHNEDPAIFEKLIDAAEEFVDEFVRPLELQSVDAKIAATYGPMGEATKALLQSVWRKKHGDAYIAESKRAAERFQEFDLDGQAIAVQKTMYEWLKEAGVLTVQDAGMKKAVEVETGIPIEVEYSESAERLQELFREAGRFEGTISVLDLDGEKGVQIQFPYSIADPKDYKSRLKPAAQFARVAAVIAKKEDLTLTIQTQQGGELSTLRFEVSDYYPKTFFRTELEKTVTTAEPLPESLPNGLTTFVFRGGKLSMFEPPLAGELAEIGQEAARVAMQKRLAAEATVPRVVQAEKDDLPKAEIAVASDQTTEPDPVVSAPKEIPVVKVVDLNTDKPEPDSARQSSLQAPHSSGDGGIVRVPRRGVLVAASLAGLGLVGLGALFRNEILHALTVEPEPASPHNQPDSTLRSPGVDYGGLGVEKIEYRDGPKNSQLLPVYEAGTDKETVAGYYREFVGGRFMLDAQNRGRWTIQEDYADQAFALGKPDEFASAITLKDVRGRRRVPLKNDQSVVAIETAVPVTLRKEKRTGTFLVEGLPPNGELKIYTQKAAANSVPPNETERESILDFPSLAKDWQVMLSFIQTNKDSLIEQRVALILEKWSTGFTYTDDPQYDALAKGKTTKEVATAIVNNRLGMCNYASTGLIALLREAGIPARHVSGKTVDSNGQEGEPHAWMEFWNGTEWKELEPLLKSADGITAGKPDAKRTKYLKTIAESAQAKTTEDLLKSENDTLKGFKDLLKNPPSIIDQKELPVANQANAPIGGITSRDIGIATVAAAVGGTATAVGNWWINRVRKVRAAEAKPSEGTPPKQI